MLTNWATAVEGTAAAPEFKAAMGALQDVQGVLRESPETQAEYVQGLRAKLTEGGGTPEDQARIDQVERVIEASNKQRDTDPLLRSEEHTSELQSLMRISYAVFCLHKQKTT